MTTAEKFRAIIIANELGGDMSAAFRFSDPDGVRSGKSGWSFGVCQFDLNNNPLASICLKECGFADEEIAALKAQTIDVTLLEPRLRAAAEIIERYDEHQLAGCIERAKNICKLFRIFHADEAALLSVADYDNQYHFSGFNKPGTLVNYLVMLQRPFTAEDILAFKREKTKYGREHPEDCDRRYKNIIKIEGERVGR